MSTEERFRADYTTDDAKPLNPQSLRNIASWLDTYDRLAVAYYDLVERFAPHDAEGLAKCREASAGDAIQRDLRRWADELEAQA